MASQKTLSALETLSKIASEIGERFEKWDNAIKNKQQPVAVQDLDFWKTMIEGAVKVLKENLE